MGIIVHPLPSNNGNKIRVKYNGVLNTADTEQIYLHAGLGYGDKWNYVTDIAMKHNEGNWIADIRVEDHDNRLNFCFKDSAEHWDNNNGDNWSYKIFK
ncbi:carbohydrate-binding protein [Orenia metallireducens]|uniref:Carbohydrate-binding protein n=1 Tax=Orenia metallireducens TaxID=1413210 RepID=A0A1C0A8L0_9FIRM|nr:carbohydrate-binding protein [Orenia metallireducens]OCL26554.1 carbohydrate-binding protein [Orenia metallireducens]